MSNEPKRSAMSERLQKAFGASRDPIFGVARNLPRVVEIDLSEITPNPDQPRKTFNEETLEELAASIEEKGLLQPIIVRKSDAGYILVAGERRFRAHQKLGKETIFAIITEGDANEISLIENIQRENLHPLEEAEALARLMERHRYTQEELGKVIGKKQNTVSELLRLTTLPDEIKREYRTSDAVSKSVLIELSRLKSADEQRTLWEQVKTGATVQTMRQKKKGQDAARQSPAARMLSIGRSFVRHLEHTSEADLVANRDQYDELVHLRRLIDEAIDRLTVPQTVEEP